MMGGAYGEANAKDFEPVFIYGEAKAPDGTMIKTIAGYLDESLVPRGASFVPMTLQQALQACIDDPEAQGVALIAGNSGEKVMDVF